MNESKKIQFWVFSFCSFLCTVFSLFIFPGYRIENSDQRFYTPAIIQRENLELFQKDFLLQNTQTTATLYDEFINIVLSNEGALYDVYFFLTFLSRLLFFLGISFISYGFTRNRIFSAIIPVFFILIHLGGSDAPIFPISFLFGFEVELHPRSLTISLLVFALGLFLNNKHLWAWILGGIAILFHFITAFPVLLFLGVWTFVQEVCNKKNYSYLKYYIFPLIAFLFLFWVILFQEKGDVGGFDLFEKVNPEWLTYLKMRTYYLFISDWMTQIMIWGRVLFPMFLFFLMLKETPFLPLKTKKFIQYVIGIFIFLIFLYIAGFEKFHSSIVLQMQFLRFFIWIKIFFFISILYIFLSDLKHRKSYIFPVVFSFVGFLLGNPYFWPFFILTFFIWHQEKKDRELVFPQWFLVFVCFWLVFISYLKFDFNISWYITNIGISNAFVFFLDGIFKNLFRIIPFLFLIPVFYFFSEEKNNQWLFCKRGGIYILGFISLVSLYVVFREMDENYYKIIMYDPHFKEEDQFKESHRLHKELISWVENDVQNQEVILFEDKEGEEFRHILSDKVIIRSLEGVERFISTYVRDRLHKNVFVKHLDGAQGTFNREYAFEWEKRMKIVQDIEAHISEIENEYEVDYVVAGEELEVPWKKVFDNERYKVYRVHSSPNAF